LIMRGIVIAFLLLFSLSVNGQFIIDSYRFGAAADDLLLDSFPNEIGAFSLRKLRKTYTGNCLVIRRISDNALDTIGFVSNFVDTARIKTFCSGTSCAVRVWFDQSGGGLTANAVQATNAAQPLIYSSGNLSKKGNNIALIFDGNDNMPLQSNANQWTRNTGVFNSFIYANGDSFNGGSPYFFGTSAGGTSRFTLAFTSTGTVITHFNRRVDGDLINSAPSSTKSINTNYLISNFVQYSSNSSTMFINGSADGSGTTGTAGTTSDTNSSASVLGGLPSSNYFIGALYELIFYKSDQSTNRAAIETNINNFYQIY
jgi:hypothetical protein